MTDDQKCNDCVYFRPNPKDDTTGECRRLPPQVICFTTEGTQPKIGPAGVLQSGSQKVTQVRIQTLFPSVVKNDPGCGEFTWNLNLQT